MHELLAETLLVLGKPAEAVTYFVKSLLRTPNRPLSLLGLARAKIEMGDPVAGMILYRQLAEIWARSDVPHLEEVNQHLETLAARDPSVEELRD